MEFVPNDAGAFRSAVDGLKEFLPEATLQFKQDCIVICGMDRSHIGFVHYQLSKKDTKVYKVSANTNIGVHMINLSRVLANVGNADVLRLSLNKAQDRLTISYSNEKIGKKAVYELPLLTIDEAAVDLPELTYSAKVCAKTSDVNGVIKEVGAFGDNINLTLNETGFIISSNGDIGSATQTLENTEDREMELTEDSVSSTFATKYLGAIMKGGAPLSSDLTLEFGGAQPLRVSFNYGSDSHFIAYMAPKVVE